MVDYHVDYMVDHMVIHMVRTSCMVIRMVDYMVIHHADYLHKDVGSSCGIMFFRQVRLLPFSTENVDFVRNQIFPMIKQILIPSPGHAAASRVIRIVDYHAVRMVDYRAIRMVDYHAIRMVDYRVIHVKNARACFTGCVMVCGLPELEHAFPLGA